MFSVVAFFLDVSVVLFLIRFAIGDNSEGLSKPLFIALTSASIVQIGRALQAGYPDSEIAIWLGFVFAVSLLVAMLILALFEVPIRKASVVAIGFAAFKIVFDSALFLSGAI